MFNKAGEWGFTKNPNPAKGIKRFREQSRERFLQPDELPRFFKALVEEPNMNARDFFLMCLFIGARRGNVMTMRWAEIDFDQVTWTIPGTATKNREPQTIPLISSAISVLMGRRGLVDGPWVFPGTSEGSHISPSQRPWRRVLQRAGIKNLRIHDLRRTMGSWQAAQGASLAIIGKSLAHKNISTTLIYSRLNLDPVRESMEKATAAILKAGQLLPDGEVVDINKAGNK